MFIIDKETAERLKKDFQVNMVLLFGSHVRGTTHPGSDIDIAIQLAQNIDSRKKLDLIDTCMTFFGGKTDISFINEASPLLNFKIARQSRLLCGGKEDYLSFVSLAARRYADTKKFRAHYDRYLESHNKAGM